MRRQTACNGWLEEMTMEDLARFKPRVVVLPLGSTEPHGPHLPMGSDMFHVTYTCREAVRAANERGAKVLLYPTLPITNNQNFKKFRFALRIGVRTLMSVIVDIVTQIKEDGVRRVVIVNGHGGNVGAIEAALREIAGMQGMPFVCWTFGPFAEGFKDPTAHPSDHGGEDETSWLMVIRPDLVRRDKLRNNPFGKLAMPSLKQVNFVRPWHQYVPAGAGGETRVASAAKGRAILEARIKGLSNLLVELSRAPNTSKFPYR